MKQVYTVNACSGMAIPVTQGQTITVVDLEGRQVVDFFAEAQGDPDTFLSTGVTIDCNESLRLSVGSILYTNRYQPCLLYTSRCV